MYKVIVFGMAKNLTVFEIDISKSEAQSNTLDWLRSKNIPIASSCNGEGVCQKCKINGDILACTSNLIEFLDEKGTIKINISYL